MQQHVAFVRQKKMERVAKALDANHMEAYIVPTISEVVPLVKTLIQKGNTLASGGSVSLMQAGVLELLKNQDYHYLDADAPGADQFEVYRQGFMADVYFASANAVTEDGLIYQVDGRSNRIAALSFGPKSVVLVVGFNKIVPGLAEAKKRNETISGPANAHRLGCKTPCAITGICSNCNGEARICCNQLIMGPQRVKGRIKVILVGEELGY